MSFDTLFCMVRSALPMRDSSRSIMRSLPEELCYREGFLSFASNGSLFPLVQHISSSFQMSGARGPIIVGTHGLCVRGSTAPNARCSFLRDWDSHRSPFHRILELLAI